MNKISFAFDPFDLIGADPSRFKDKSAMRDEIATFIVDQVRDYCAKGNTPISGGAWKKSLSKAYKARKVAEGGASFSDMELKGDMLDALECVTVKGGMLELRITGKQAGKADGHNNHSGDSRLPAREFIPKDGQTFKRDVLSGIREIALEYVKGAK